MQLNVGQVAATLGLMAAGLLGTSPAQAQAQAQDATPAASAPGNAYDQTASETGTTVVDSAVLFYQEDDHRVRAIEADSGATWNMASGTVLSAKFTYDSLTGATPNGATRSRWFQRFSAPAKRGAESGGPLPMLDTITGASGSYMVMPGQLPLDSHFKDHREAVDVGATLPVADGLKLSLGGSVSYETDYRSFSGRVSLAKELNQKNTTLSLGFNFERDTSQPFTGIPRALSGMGDYIVGHARSKRIYSLVAGVTQVIRPNWLVQLNYNFGHNAGYQTDPYKLVSLVDSTTGDPYFYIYEKRPERRDRQSIYLGSKLALGSFVTDASARYYHDSWGIDALTFELSEHVPVGRSFYIAPLARWYHQTAADFYRPYLAIDAATPDAVSSDSRLGRFGAWTAGIKAGAHISSGIELYVAGERYWQYGQRYDPSAPGHLAHVDLFSGTRSYSVMSGLRLTFR